MSLRIILRAVFLLTAAFCAFAVQAAKTFHLEEATIDSIHDGIRSGEITCEQVVESYIARARAYNGICTSLVTKDGTDAPMVPGTVRAGSPLKFPRRWP